MSHRCKLTPLYAAMLGVLIPVSAAGAADNYYVPEDGSLFWLEIYPQGESFTLNEPTGYSYIIDSYYTLEQSAIDSIKAGWSYWSTILGPTAKNTKPVRIAVAGFDYTDNASSYSPTTTNGNTYLAEAILNDRYYVSDCFHFDRASIGRMV